MDSHLWNEMVKIKATLNKSTALLFTHALQEKAVDLKNDAAGPAKWRQVHADGQEIITLSA
jgi:hypothetical protein